MAAHPLPLYSSPKLQLEEKKPVVSVSHRFRGLHLVTKDEPVISQPANSLEQAHRIVAQVEWEIQQQAARERAYRQNRWRSPIAVHTRGTQDGFFDRLRHVVGF